MNGWIWASDGKFAVRFEVRKGIITFAPPMFWRSKGKNWRDVVRFLEWKKAEVKIFGE